MLHTSGISQAVVSKIFDHWGGFEGFLSHTKEVTAFYRERRDAMVIAGEAQLFVKRRAEHTILAYIDEQR